MLVENFFSVLQPFIFLPVRRSLKGKRGCYDRSLFWTFLTIYSSTTHKSILHSSTFHDNEDIIAPNMPQISNGHWCFFCLLCFFVAKSSSFFFFFVLFVPSCENLFSSFRVYQCSSVAKTLVVVAMPLCVNQWLVFQLFKLINGWLSFWKEFMNLLVYCKSFCFFTLLLIYCRNLNKDICLKIWILIIRWL